MFNSHSKSALILWGVLKIKLLMAVVTLVVLVGCTLTTEPAKTTDYTLSYNDITVLTNKTLSAVTPQWSTNQPEGVTYTIAPSLPSGLNFNTNTGEISGKAPDATSSDSYTVTATVPGLDSGSVSATLTINVIVSIDISIYALNYKDIGVVMSNGVETYTIYSGEGSINEDPQWSDGSSTVTPKVTYSIEPYLPARTVSGSRGLGFLFNPNTGKITDDSAGLKVYYGKHTITATGIGDYYHGSNSTEITIAIVTKPSGTLGTLVGEQMNLQGRSNINLNIIDTSEVTSMLQAFQGMSGFDVDISRWDVSGVTNMYEMFQGASNFQVNMSGWDVSSVTNMARMFAEVSNFQVNMSGWDVSSVKNMPQMFFQASNFTVLNMNDWNVSNVTDMSSMFYQSSFNGDISGWDVSSVTNMSTMFYGATLFNHNLEVWGDQGSEKGLPRDGNGITTDRSDMFLKSGVTSFPSWCSSGSDSSKHCSSSQ